MRIDDRFSVPLPPADAFQVLLDLDRVARCMPGAELKDARDGEYEGVVKVKIGPVNAEYRGVASFEEVDTEQHRIVLRAKGRDVRGQGNAEAIVRARLEAAPAGSEVALEVELDVKGRVAQFGRGVVTDVSRKLLKQFADALERELQPGAAESNGVGEPGSESHAASSRTVPPADQGAIDLVDLVGRGRLAVGSVVVGLVVVFLAVVTRRRR